MYYGVLFIIEVGIGNGTTCHSAYCVVVSDMLQIPLCLLLWRPSVVKLFGSGIFEAIGLTGLLSSETSRAAWIICKPDNLTNIQPEWTYLVANPHLQSVL